MWENKIKYKGWVLDARNWNKKDFAGAK